MSKPKVAFVVQRCGPDIFGGAERHCFLVAQKMSPFWDIEILTTCAKDYMTWKNEYPDGIEQVENIVIKRFMVDFPRNIEKFNAYSNYIYQNMHRISIKECEKWMKMQGPISSHLFQYLEDKKNDYEAFIFFTYLYATSYYGLPIVADKTFLVPTAHDEWPIYLPIWDNWFDLPNAFIFNTYEEKTFLQNRFPLTKFKGDVVGIGIDVPSQISLDLFKTKYKIDFPYVLYLGRIDASKGCEELFEFFIKYKKQCLSSLKLVLCGVKILNIPSHPDIVYVGQISEEEKFSAIFNCECLVNPSPFESLSLVLLEAWALNKPVLVNGKCDVLVGQCKRSNAGLWYTNYDEFVECLNFLLDNKDLAKNASEFVTENYSWDVIQNKILKLLEKQK